jgi:hypothetical protein
MTAPVRLTTEGLFFTGISNTMPTLSATSQLVEVVQGSWGWTATTPCVSYTGSFVFCFSIQISKTVSTILFSFDSYLCKNVLIIYPVPGLHSLWGQGKSLLLARSTSSCGRSFSCKFPRVYLVSQSVSYNYLSLTIFLQYVSLSLCRLPVSVCDGLVWNK